MLIYPRLPGAIARTIAAELAILPPDEARSRAALEHDAATYAPTGGSRVTTIHLRTVQSSLRSLADEHLGQAGDAKGATFDLAAARVLHAELQIPAGDAANSGVWQFLTCILCPDIVRLRFPGKEGASDPKRFLSGPRNTLGRLWWRAHIFRDSPGVLEKLGEDEVVQIMERPEVAGHRALVAELSRRLDHVSRNSVLPASRMIVMRDVMKRVRRLLPVLSFESLETRELEQVVARIFQDSISALQEATSNLA